MHGYKQQFDNAEKMFLDIEILQKEGVSYFFLVE